MSSVKRPSIRIGPAVDFLATDAVHSGLGAGFAVKFGIRMLAVRSLWKGFGNFESTRAWVPTGSFPPRPGRSPLEAQGKRLRRPRITSATAGGSSENRKGAGDVPTPFI